ncbi:MAG: glycosyltransferase family 2 protein [Candidatus Aenigmarchaeota archaeon]|nr:glycosyltransferase family 2 protein [Candidatus Aenigmarchaeota archaeon]
MIVIVIPAYNEEKTVAGVVREAKKYGKVVVVDDSSKDGTAAEARKAGAFIIRHKTNSGLGSALRSGFSKAVGMKADIVVTIDADGQHDPREIKKFISLIDDGYDFVLGTRNLSSYPFVKKVGNFFLNGITNFVSGTHLKDTESGFRAFRGDALKRLYLKAERYEIAVEIVFEVGRNKMKHTSVPITSPRYVKGVGVWDGVKNFAYLLHRKRRTVQNTLEDIVYVFRNKF